MQLTRDEAIVSGRMSFTDWERGGMFLKMEVRLAVLGAGESSSMSSSSLLISIGFSESSSPATTDEVIEDAEEEDVTEEPLLEARTAMDGMVGPTAGAIGTEPMTTS